MAVDRLVRILAGQHLLPALLGSIPIAFVLLLAFRAGLRRPGQRALLLPIALAKVAFLVWQGEDISCLKIAPVGQVGRFSLTLPSALPSSWDDARFFRHGPPHASTLANEMLVALLVLAAALLCYRWFRLAPLCRVLRGASLANEEFAHVCRSFEKLAYRASGRWLPRPRLLVVRGTQCTAFAMGIRPPVVVLSAELAEQMGERELLGVLAHELAHVRRLDYVVRWFATVLRDVMIWNPFVWAWYRQLIEEQERASDEFAADLLEDPVAVASGLVEVSAYSNRVPLLALGPLAAWQRGSGARRLEQRLGRLEAKLAGRTEGWPLALFCPAALLFAVAQPHIVLPLNHWPQLLLR